MRKHLAYLAALLCLLLLFSACNEKTSKPPKPTPTAVATAGQFQEYSLPSTNSGLMRPTLDSKGRLWFGAMGQNALIMFDPQSQKFSPFTPPNGKFGIMGVAVAKDDTIWFAEQHTNYIGQYNPQTKKWKTYPLPVVTTPDPSNPDKTLSLSSAPNELAIDHNGNIWFTEMNADMLGMLNIKTGKFEHHQIGPQKTVQTLSPYGITIDAQGIIWFTQASVNQLGRFDPFTGLSQLYTVKNLDSPLMMVTSDATGKIWATTFRTPHLVSFDPSDETFVTYLVSDKGKTASGLYDLVIAADGSIWTTATAANQLAQFDVTKKHFTFYDIPTDASTPLGLKIAPDGTIWFTEASGNKVGSLKPTA